MRKLRRLADYIDFGTEWIGKGFSLLSMMMMLILTIEVVLRYGFNRPTIWAWDISTQLAGAFALVGGAYAFLHGDHVKVDVISSRFSGRLKAVLELLLAIPLFLLCLVLLWHGGSLAWTSVLEREVAITLFAPPLYPLKVLLVLASFLLLLQGIAKFIRDLEVLFTIAGKEEI